MTRFWNTFISYTQNQKIGEPNNLNFGSNETLYENVLKDRTPDSEYQAERG